MTDRDIRKEPQALDDEALDEASGGLPAVQTPQATHAGDGSVRPIISVVLGDGSVRPGG